VPSVSVQFHALPSELLSLLDSFADEVEGLHFAALRFPPFRVSPIDRSGLADAFRDPSVGRLRLSLSEPAPATAPMIERPESNPNHLLIDIGRQTDEGLAESWLTATTDNPTALAVWRKLARRLKAMTKAGAIAVNPKTGEQSTLRNHRYSAGAEEAQRAGVAMLPAGGTSRLIFGK
jgi:hypothetical protein